MGEDGKIVLKVKVDLGELGVMMWTGSIWLSGGF
jgi:hypothetical protein